MISLYVVIFRRLRQREKARTLRNARRQHRRRSQLEHNSMATATHIENERISNALIIGAKMARELANHFKTRTDQMLMELSLQVILCGYMNFFLIL